MAVYAISVFVGGVMQNMWAPWRMEYILSKKENNGCVFCLDSFNPELTEEDERRAGFRHAEPVSLCGRTSYGHSFQALHGYYGAVGRGTQ